MELAGQTYLGQVTTMSKINATPEELVNQLYEILDEVGNIPHPMADELYSEINQYLLEVVVDDE